MRKNITKALADIRKKLDVENNFNIGALLKSEERLKSITEIGNVRGFLERWVAGKIDPGGEAAAAEASDHAFGYEWRDCAKLSRLHRACAPDVPESPNGGDSGGKATAVARYVEGVVGTSSLVNPIDIQSGSEQAITQVAAAFFLTSPEIKSLSKPVQGHLQALETQLDALQQSSRRMVELGGEQASESDERDERFYKGRIEIARSFLSVYARASKTAGQAEVCTAQVISRLREENEAWIQVYRNVSDMTIRQLGRKLAGAQQALDRLTSSLDAHEVSYHCRWRLMNAPGCRRPRAILDLW